MKTRLKDIAEHLNLSSGLVSGVLNERDNVWASVETRARVFQAARDLNYGDFAPRAADPKREDPLDVLLLGGWQPAFGPLVGALSALRTLTLLAPSGEEARRWASTRSPHPVVIAGPREQVAPLITDLAGPFAVIAESPVDDEIGFDLAAMAAGAIDHLRALGHQRIAYLGSGPTAFWEGYVAWTKTVFGQDALQVDATEAALLGALTTYPSPTAWVVGGSPDTWELLVATLARQGKRLGFGANDPAACGLLNGNALAVGEVLAYDTDAGIALLAQAAYATLRGEDVSRIVRLRLTRAAGREPQFFSIIPRAGNKNPAPRPAATSVSGNPPKDSGAL